MATQTPMRQVPGAFFQTPAPGNDPVRRQLFPMTSSTMAASSGPSTSIAGGTQGLVSTTGSSGLIPSTSSGSLQHNILPPNQQPVDSTASLPPVLRAAKAVNQVLQLDESYPDLDSYCKRTLVPSSSDPPRLYWP